MSPLDDLEGHDPAYARWRTARHAAEEAEEQTARRRPHPPAPPPPTRNLGLIAGGVAGTLLLIALALFAGTPKPLQLPASAPDVEGESVPSAQVREAPRPSVASPVPATPTLLAGWRSLPRPAAASFDHGAATLSVERGRPYRVITEQDQASYIQLDSADGPQVWVRREALEGAP